MKMPLWSEAPEFKPRKRPGIDQTLTPFEREILDSVDVLEQRSEFNTTYAIRAWNAVLMISAVLILTNGPAILGFVQGWLQHR